MTNAKKTHDIVEKINDLAKEINKILDDKLSDRYFEGIVIIYSFIEAVLKWLIFIQIAWNKSSDYPTKHPPDEFIQVKNFCNNSRLDQLLNLGLSVGLLDYRLFSKLDAIREERNQILHRYWLYIHKGNRLVLRKKLEKLASTGNRLVEKFNALIGEVGADDSYDIFEVSDGRNFTV